MYRQLLTLVACLSALAIGTAKARAAEVPVDPPAATVQEALAQTARVVEPVAAAAAAPVADGSAAAYEQNEPRPGAPAPPSQGSESEPAPNDDSSHGSAEAAPGHTGAPAEAAGGDAAPPKDDQQSEPEGGEEPEAGGSGEAGEPPASSPPAGADDNSAEAGGDNTSDTSTGADVQQGAGQNAPAAQGPETAPSSQPAATTPPAIGAAPATETPAAPSTPTAAVSDGAGDATPPPATGLSEPAETAVSTPPTGSQATERGSCGRRTTRATVTPRHRKPNPRPRRTAAVERPAQSLLAVAHPAETQAAAAVVQPRPVRPAVNAQPEPKVKHRPVRPTAPIVPHPRLRVDMTGSRLAQSSSNGGSPSSKRLWLLFLAMLLATLGISGLAYAGLPARGEVAAFAHLGSRLRSKGLSNSRAAWHAVKRLRPGEGRSHDGIRYRE